MNSVNSVQNAIEDIILHNAQKMKEDKNFEEETKMSENVKNLNMKIENKEAQKEELREVEEKKDATDSIINDEENRLKLIKYDVFRRYDESETYKLKIEWKVFKDIVRII